jgi:hypothetical protein
MEFGQPFNPFGLFTGIFIPEGLARANGVSPGAKLAYGRLVRYGGQDGKCYPSVSTLASEIGVRERQAQRYLAELEHAKLIRRVRRVAGGRGQTSNAYQFLWHSLLDAGMKKAAQGEGVSDMTPGGMSDMTPKESQREESQNTNTDLDYQVCEMPKNGISQPGLNARAATHSEHPKLREALADYMALPGDKDRAYPSERVVVDVMHAAVGATEDEVVACLRHLRENRGLRLGTKHGPRHWSWFKTVVADYFRQERERAYPPAAAWPEGTVDSMTDAIEIPEQDADYWPRAAAGGAR